MKRFLVMNFKGNTAMKRVLAFLLVMAMTLTMSVNVLAAKKTKINKSSVSLYVGRTFQLKLTGTSIQSVRSSIKGVATVTKKGKVTAKKAGTATITLKGKNNKAYKCKVTVKNTIINKKAISLYAGKTYKLKLTGTTIASVKTSNNNIATVTTKGVVKAIGAGSATITLTGKNKINHTCKVTVNSTTISKSDLTLTEGETYQLTLTGTSIASVKTSNLSVAAVNDNGLVTAKGGGTATITLTGANKKNHTCRVTVKAKVIKVTGVKLSTTKPDIGQTITATSEPENANNIKSYQWYYISDDEKWKIAGATTAEHIYSWEDTEFILICVVTDQDGNEFCSKEISFFEP